MVPIPGTTKLHRLEENIGAADGELTADDLREIEDASAGIAMQGERLPLAALNMIDRWGLLDMRLLAVTTISLIFVASASAQDSPIGAVRFRNRRLTSIWSSLGARHGWVINRELGLGSAM
ncbi:MAG TPA: hypothetical protein VEX68_21825 [Bryobacteraceae bacterium]|nr:hypothetical protein [Bryobacteraceae bacterium]